MRKRVRFTGWVQGVGFRANVRYAALAHNVTGWVQNEPDGSVLAEIQGLSKDIDLTLEAIRSRMHTHIRGEDTISLEDEVGESGFVIRR